MAVDLSLPDPLEKLLVTAGIAYSVQEQEPPPPGGGEQVVRPHVVRTLVFRDRSGRFVLAACPAETRVQYGRLARAVGISRSELRAAAPDELELLGMEPGGAGPLGARGEVAVVIDAAVEALGQVQCGTGRAGQSLVLTAADLIALADGAVMAEITAPG